MVRKKLAFIFLSMACILSLTACNVGEDTRNDTDYRILISNSGIFLYEFRDADTGVWYICNDGGITPKLNKDGSLYTEDK